MTEQMAREGQRIAAVYARRKLSDKERWYRWDQQSALWERYRLRAVAAAMLRQCGWDELAGREALDVGCGAGGWLRTLLEWGIPAGQLHGIDLLEERIAHARALAPQLDLRQASGWAIPYLENRMDLVSAHTVFSSILDPEARAVLAREMLRVAKPGGLVMVYDFRVADPRNRDTVGISPAEMRRLFPGHRLRCRTLTLLPPVARRLAQLSPFLVALAEWLLPPLRTHRMYLVEKGRA